jgi:hypothetical protein
MATPTVRNAFVIIDELSKIIELALFDAIGRGDAKDIVTFTKDGVAVGIDIPGILRMEVFDMEFARRAKHLDD